MQSQGGSGAPAGNHPFRPLNVKDALSYLDRVKVTFNDQSEVYDRFLTIMKEFKSQGIDTPGVIERVSTLFRGHPALIQGFNTFLPPGYRIECTVSSPSEGTVSSSGGTTTTITVTTPMGMTTRTQVSVAAARRPELTTGGSSGSRTPVLTRPSPVAEVAPPRPLATTTAVAATERTQSVDNQVPGPSTVAKQHSAPVQPSSSAPLRNSGDPYPHVRASSGAVPTLGGAGTTSAPPPSETSTTSKPGSTNNNNNNNSLHLPSIPPPTAASISASASLATPVAASLLSSHLPSSAAAAAAVVAAGNGNGGAGPASTAAGEQQGARPPMEFNHAINYVNKIKNRFVRDPDTYKAFLEILQTYQKEGRAIQDVYAQVTTLFHSAPDLLDEFKQFLPDTSADPAATSSSMLGQMSTGNSGGIASRSGSKRPSSTTQKRDEQHNSAKKAKVTSKSKIDDKNKGKRTNKDMKDNRKGPSQDDGAYSEGPGPEGALPYGHHNHLNPYPPGYAMGGYPAQATHVGPYAYEPPPLPPPPVPLLLPKPQASSNDVAFFSRVKAYTIDPGTYHEFLKLLNLYTQDIIDLTALVSRAFLFIGQEPSLWREFREIVGWSEGKAVGDAGGRIEIVDGVRIVENVPSLDGPRRSKGDAGKGWKTYGPSYRQLPASEISLNCSGRDALCWDVLNDEWVSQPSWASDEGFVAHRKNPFEEALHRSEEERHEYDYHIEANLRTIALLEPIATRIAIMEADERSTFRLKPGLGNQSKSIYQRVIKKVYGKEQGGEVIQALHENPCVAVPIVLARLKQKDDEWKRALREWNRVWREVDAKNFWKSLDHQAISLKANDKRTHTAKNLVTEIETIKREQRQRSQVTLMAVPSSTQLRYTIADRAALSDAVKLVFSFLDRTTSVSSAEKDRLDAFLRQFIPSIFALTTSELGLDVVPTTGHSADDDLDSAEGTSDAGFSTAEDQTEGSSTPGGSKRGLGKKAGGDLRKKALKNAVGPSGRGGGNFGPGRRSKVSSPAPSSRAVSPALSATAVDTDTVMADVVASASSVLAEIGALADASEAAGTPAFGDRSGSEVSMAVVEDTASPSVADVEGVPSRVGTPEPTNLMDNMPELIIPVDDRNVTVEARRQWNAFANSNLYCLLRLVQVSQQIVYHRLTLLKSSAIALTTPPKPEPITEKHVPSLSHSLTLVPSMASSGGAPNLYYQRALGLCEKLFDGDVDQQQFEEGMRQMFGTQGYMLFTIDKVLLSIIKHSQAAIADSKSQELLELLVQDRAHPDRSTPSQQKTYRSQAEGAIGNDENLYRFEWIPEQSSLAVQLVGKDSIPADDLETAEREWAAYLERFVLAETTPGIGITPRNPFLKRNLKRASPAGVDKFPPNLTVKSSLQCRICLRSYRIFYVSQTEDFIFRSRTATEVEPPRVERAAQFEKWLEARKLKLESVPASETAEAAVVDRVPVPVQDGEDSKMET
ncbi:paired amphipathic helix protein Sin3a, partial [Phenoliferia sp. Uapishka_3]